MPGAGSVAVCRLTINFRAIIFCVHISQLSIVTPCYNEGNVVHTFLNQVQHALDGFSGHCAVVVVNDGSTDDTRQQLHEFKFTAERISLHIVDLPMNIGHQAAIYQGLLVAQRLAGTHIIIMDADGEDAPSIITELLMQPDVDITHVVRSGRHEGVLFLALYGVYKLLFCAITGRQMNFGNYCLISRRVMDRALAAGFVHFPAFLLRQQCSRQYIMAPKGRRIGGHSKMTLPQHVRHALSSLAEYCGGVSLVITRAAAGMGITAVCIGGAGWLAGYGVSVLSPWAAVAMLMAVAGILWLLHAGGRRRSTVTISKRRADDKE